VRHSFSWRPALDREKAILPLKDRTRRSRRRRFAVALTIVVGLLGAVVGVSLAAGLPDTQAASSLAAPKSATRKQMPNPVRIVIPAIGVNARVIPLGLNRDQTIQVPTNAADTGWFRPGPEPGEQGAAVIVGHVATRSGPGVFYRLRQLHVGQLITIRLQDGSTVRYVARSMITVLKSRFPTNRVYARTTQPTLRLITCAGKLNPSTGHHPENYIVFASIVR
jgi:sortase (surface protein transpeptidase)